ncbi:MAG: alpha/beta hydrolase family protein [Flavobacteriales bacterium]
MKTFVIPSQRNKNITLDINFAKTKNCPLVIFSHGFKGFKDWGPFNTISDIFVQSGLNFLKFNFSHNGVSSERPLEFSDLEAFGNNNFSIELEDLESVIEWAKNNLEQNVDLSRIYLLGHSRGGGISILKAVTNSNIKKLVSWASVSDFEKRIENDKVNLWKDRGVVYVFNNRTNQQMPLYYQFYEDYINNKSHFSIPKACRKLSIPTLIIHGDNDQTVDFIEAEELRANISNSILLKIEDSDHVFNAKHPFDENFMPIQLKKVIAESISFFKI